MATGDYCTIEQLREEIIRTRTYVASTISFDSASKEIRDSANGLHRFPSPPDGTTGRTVSIKITGALDAGNNATFTIATGSTPAKIIVNESLTTHAAGAAITITDVSDLDDDTRLTLAISAASRAIEQATGRFFYQRSSEARYYNADDRERIYIDDCVSISALATDNAGDRTYATVWATTDYDLEPFNAALEVEAEPYQSICRTPNGNYYFPFGSTPYVYLYGSPSLGNYNPNGQKAVKVTGVWGWPSVPTDIQKACIIQAARYFKRGDAVFGMFGDTSMGGSPRQIPQADPDMKAICNNRRKNWTG